MTQSHEWSTQETKLGDEPDSSICRSNQFTLNLLKLSLHSNTELRDRSDNNTVIAARQTDLGLTGLETRTDFSIRQADGSQTHFEEYPTPKSSIDPNKADIVGPLYEYNPNTDTRGKQLEPSSTEYKLAQQRLQQLRAQYTIPVILNLPKCE